MEGTKWPQHISNSNDVLGAIIHDKFLSDILPNVQGKLCTVRFILSVLQIFEPHR
jgi:hypothetical protein